MSYRSDVVDQIKPLLPDTWQVVPYADEPDVLQTPLVMVASQGIAPGVTPAKYDITMHVYVLIPTAIDALTSEDDVEDAVLLTLHALLRMRAVTQGNAERVSFAGKHPAWDITINVHANVLDDDTPPADTLPDDEKVS